MILEELVARVAQWGHDRKITVNGRPITQGIKTLEECHELLEAINRNDIYEIRDAIGDIMVTLIMQAELQGFPLEECLHQAYSEIKDRKGELNEVGDFIKE
jgi:NTP pyrophosphatase (non-canonical NTP hydrolase)